jgi:hypothetical protein
LDEKALSAGLHAVARADLAEAPAATEAVLRRALNERGLAAKSVPVFRSASANWRWFAAAAALIIATAFLFQFGSNRNEPVPNQPAADLQPEETQKRAAKEGSVIPPAAEGRAEPEAVPVAPSRKRRLVAGGALPQAPQRPAEVATRFYPLKQLDDASALESWRLVRTEVPKSSLAFMGVPVEWDGPEDRVKADILLGNDGLAYAVRFVR